ncbi:MAG: LptF/LptG family permease [Bacteroidales bacterium]|nr:LptF/LptG family permease [Bacteroidales bacterium]MCM1147069.1 LptF/LptG family permease [Bacteroidales bacterium]MCM1205798.1 LptF/LptG family permease [Bacillota bacterium]MCM1509959.1 LptF/LptG family permease [Clostridium sp.]
MFRIKKLDIFIAKQFGLLFAGTFFICQFVLMMQFLWRYVDELIGKGLSLEVLAKFFFYMGLMLVPQAMPLAILLSSLIAFGNLGESSELTAIKAAGISLMQAFRSLIVIALFITAGSYFFQNDIAPECHKKMAQLLVAMKQKSPELEIPEGVFYDGIPDCNLYVQKKDVGTGMLYGVMIYRMTDSFEDAAIILADSGRLQSTADKHHIVLTLQAGEWFENMKSQEMAGTSNVPYRRETFVSKRIVLDYNDDLEVDNDVFAGDARGKSISAIRDGLVKTRHAIDSVGRSILSDVNRQYFTRYVPEKRDSVTGARLAKAGGKEFDPDSVYAGLPADNQRTALTQMVSEVRMAKDFLAFGGLMSKDGHQIVREHYLEWINKFTTASLCLIFFFIGAPLGAIIRKGGLGVPVIISVVVFIIFYILDNTGFRMARIGDWPVWFAKGIAPAVLIPTAVFFTYKANKDSVVFNMDMYVDIFRKILGLRLKRRITMKQVVIDEPDYAGDRDRLRQITDDIAAYTQKHRLWLMPDIIKVFFFYVPDKEVERIVMELESVMEDLGNTREKDVMRILKQYPVVSVKAHTRPFDRRWMNIAAFVLFPVGAFLYVRMWRFRLRLFTDLKKILELNEVMTAKIDTLLYNKGA